MSATSYKVEKIRTAVKLCPDIVNIIQDNSFEAFSCSSDGESDLNFSVKIKESQRLGGCVEPF